jgi:SAM-dependent methyltransferase
MWRGLGKGVILGAAGRLPGGARAYLTVTREWMGTQGTHVDKLRRVWPGYVEQWRRAGVALEGAEVWVHEGGWTPFPSFGIYLATGRGGVVTNARARVLDRYLGRAANGAIACELRGVPDLDARRARLEPLRWAPTARSAVEGVGGRLVEAVSLGRIPIADASVDLCHSGGALEHVDPRSLDAFLRECRRILRPGGVMSHVVDHRDHLHHADRTWPYLGHLVLGPRTYAAACGTPLQYHNRLAPSGVTALLERAGFEPIAIRRLPGPTGEWADDEAAVLAAPPGLDRARLAPAFRGISQLDLRTAATHFLFRAPG